MAVNKRVESLYTGLFDGIETFAANTALLDQELVRMMLRVHFFLIKLI